MITIAEVNTEIYNLKCSIADRETTTANSKKMRSRIEELCRIVLFLESNPTKETLESQLKYLVLKEGVITENFGKWYAANPEYKAHKKPRELYQKQMDLPKIQDQMRTLRYILKVV